MNSEHQDFPLISATDVTILMHREVHFGGNFNLMLEYYERGGIGTHPELETNNILELAKIERKMEQNLAPLFLSGSDAEKVATAKEAYKNLRNLYEEESEVGPFPLLIADLILSEEEEPTSEIAAIVKEKGAIVPSLLELLKAENFYDPLFPGYGKAPVLAARCLGLIGDKRAIISLFESVKGDDFFDEDTALDALKLIGKPAKEFLLHVVQGYPLNIDNERAAISLISFKEDPNVGKVCLRMLDNPEVRKSGALATYLALACERLVEEEDRETFRSLADAQGIPKELKQDILTVAGEWEGEG